MNEIDFSNTSLTNNQLNCICSTSLLNELSGLDNFKGVLKDIEKDYPYARQMKNDGNSFYRCFMFSLLENYIVYNKIDKLNSFICNFNESLIQNLEFDLHDLPVDKIRCLQILFIIKNYLEKKDIKSGYQFFIKALIFIPNFFIVRINLINFKT